MTPETGGYIIPGDTRLRIWRVIASRADGERDTFHPLPARVPAYTPAEAACLAARMSGLPREQWAAYTWTPEPMEGNAP